VRVHPARLQYDLELRRQRPGCGGGSSGRGTPSPLISTWAEIIGYRRVHTYVLRMTTDPDFRLDR
jgi:hypothetical protein